MMRWPSDFPGKHEAPKGEANMKRTIAEWLRKLADKLDPPIVPLDGGGGGPIEPP